MPSSFPFFGQHDALDCGPACLRMLARFHGQHFSLEELRQRCQVDREGVSLFGISDAAEQIGFRTIAARLPFEAQNEDESGLTDAPLPCIVHWEGKHFVVVYKIRKRYVHIADPAVGKRKLSHVAFKKSWIDAEGKGTVLLLEPGPAFFEMETETPDRSSFGYLFSYLKPYRRLWVQLLLGLLLGSVFQLLFPFLTQAVVDIGIQNQDIGFIWLILLGQLVLFVGQMSVQFIQNWILLHIGTRVNISILYDFLAKLMKLPLRFFDTKMTGDLLQRIDDHRRIEWFLTQSALGTLFSTFNLIVFGVVLFIYSRFIFLLFLIGSLLYVGWVFFFLKRRAVVDHQRFEQLADNQHSLIEMIQGMSEIKLQNSERRHRWQWAGIQAKLFRTNTQALKIAQYQDAGAGFITQLKDIIITFVAAKAVVEGQMTLGMMLAVQYIIGQLNGPLQQAIAFIRSAQDARISLERLAEIHDQENEESEGIAMQTTLPKSVGNIQIQNLHFGYNRHSDPVLSGIDLSIPEGKVTAIVGRSGSGKTTLVKLLLGFYKPDSGQIRIGNFSLNQLSKQTWRGRCGAVMQDGFIFSDTLARNIATRDEAIDSQRLAYTTQLANLDDFVATLPLGFQTMIGQRGNAISQGQRQRILIARAVYKNPDILFFDEATNALDAHNEKIILGHLERFFQHKTVIVIAHRLSTVKNADQIVVLENGQIAEKGTHEMLIAKRGAYFELVREQLDLEK